MDTHKNARLTPKGREGMVRAMVDNGLTKAEVARRYNTTPKTVAKVLEMARRRFQGLATKVSPLRAAPPRYRYPAKGAEVRRRTRSMQ